MFFVIINLPWIYILNSYYQYMKFKLFKGHRIKIKITKQKINKIYTRSVNKLIIFFLNIIVPILAILNNQFVFLSFMTLYFIALIFISIKAFRYEKVINKIFRIFIIVDFGVHHFSFVIMTALSLFNYD
jgi:hypothetical protein